MEFCPRCGSVIVVNDNMKAACAKCSYKPRGKVKIESSEKIDKADKVAVIEEKELTTYPRVEMKCSECKHKECYFWTLQTRSSDEPETKFYKCTKCDHTWREYR